MRILYLPSIIYIALILSSCASTNPKPPANLPPQHKDPIAVSLLNKEQPSRPYTILGKASVSKYNMVGIKRQQATIHDLMRQQAAMLDGDAIIDLKNKNSEVTATVIAYKQILV